jgi:hypothetical protein
MLKHIAITLLMLTPLAAAGAHVGADALPAATDACTSDSASDWWGDSETRDGTTYYWSSQDEHASTRCDGRTDTVALAVTANDATVASARYGEGSQQSSESSASTWNSGSYADDWSRGDYQTSTWQSAESRGTREKGLTVETMPAALRVIDGCSTDERTRDATDSSGAWDSQDGWMTEDRRSDGSYSETSRSSECGQTATLATGITTVDAGRVEGCDQVASSDSYSSSDYAQGWSYSSRSARDASGCHETTFASAGTERVESNSADGCERSTSDWTSVYGGSAYRSASEAESCRKTQSLQAGGATILFVDASDSWSGCSDSEPECPPETATASKSLVVSHPYTGATVVPLP